MSGTGIYNNVNGTIIERCKIGDRKAFHELYDLYAPAMFNVALRILNNQVDAEEVLQDAFFKAFDKIVTYTGEYSFGAWLKKIVINTSLDALKKRKVLFVPLEMAGALQEDDYTANEEETEYDVNVIKQSVAELPDGYRTILSLFLFEDYSHREISEALGISEGTSKSQYNRAKRKLVELIKQKMEANAR